MVLAGTYEFAQAFLRWGELSESPYQTKSFGTALGFNKEHPIEGIGGGVYDEMGEGGPTCEIGGRTITANKPNTHGIRNSCAEDAFGQEHAPL